jgi:class 3 adenylate cyclase
VFEGILASTELLRQCRVKQGPSIRLALHYGPIDEDSGLLNDETIGVAVQIQSYGKTNAVVVSRAVYDQIYSHPQFKAKLLGKFEIQGLPGLTEVFVLMGFGLTPSFALNWISRVKESVQKASQVIRSIF